MTKSGTRRPLKTGGMLWGQRRVAAGMSIRQLSKRSGISRGLLSLMENGRMVPKADEYDAVMTALDSPEPPPSDDSGPSTT